MVKKFINDTQSTLGRSFKSTIKLNPTNTDNVQRYGNSNRFSKTYQNPKLANDQLKHEKEKNKLAMHKSGERLSPDRKSETIPKRSESGHLNPRMVSTAKVSTFATKRPDTMAKASADHESIPSIKNRTIRDLESDHKKHDKKSK